MKKKYSTPCTSIEFALPASQLMKAGSIQNASGDVQTGINDNDDDNFEAGAKGGFWGKDTDFGDPWDK